MWFLFYFSWVRVLCKICILMILIWFFNVFLLEIILLLLLLRCGGRDGLVCRIWWEISFGFRIVFWVVISICKSLFLNFGRLFG